MYLHQHSWRSCSRTQGLRGVATTGHGSCHLEAGRGRGGEGKREGEERQGEAGKEGGGRREEERQGERGEGGGEAEEKERQKH